MPTFADDTSAQSKPASPQTIAANAAVLKELPFSNVQDFSDAKRGFIGTTPMPIVNDTTGKVCWDLNRYNFINDGPPPDTMNPSLWRLSRLNMNNGLFKVTDRVYQIRGFDLANMTIIEGDTGLIIIDTLLTTEVSHAGLELYFRYRPQKEVVAVIYTHSHADHYGGVKGVISEKDVNDGKVQVIAPAGFLEEAVSENVFAGNAMNRRTMYQYGEFLASGTRGQVDSGIGKTLSDGTFTLIPPTYTIKTTGEKLTVDGVQMEFQMAPDTEAPSEMLIYFPQFKVLNIAEDATHTLHNLYTLRGAQIRNANNWWKTLNDAIQTYGDKTDVVIAQHQWPTWGHDQIDQFLCDQRDTFKYIHDQSLHLANQGYTPIAIGEMLKLPESLAKRWYERGYYGTVNQNAKAVYQRYLGWYDGNPANLHPLPEDVVAKKYVDLMGGAGVILPKAQQAYDAGEYRWVAELLKHVVFADPSNKKACNLQADAFEQLGYQMENPTWRNEYLMAAYELRNGVMESLTSGTSNLDMIEAMSPELILDYMGIRLDGFKAADKMITIIWQLPDTHTSYALELRNGVLIYTKDKQIKNPDAIIIVGKNGFAGLLMGNHVVQEEIETHRLKITGNAEKVHELYSLLGHFNPRFNIVTPLDYAARKVPAAAGAQPVSKS